MAEGAQTQAPPGNHTDAGATPRLPAVSTLSDAQLRGAACVWCGADLRRLPGVVDLGRRLYPGARSHWFPRACPTCPVGGGR